MITTDTSLCATIRLMTMQSPQTGKYVNVTSSTSIKHCEGDQMWNDD